MSKKTIRPSTLDGIKRLTRSIKIEKGIQHTSALDKAARMAGFQNFRHARNMLHDGGGPERQRTSHRTYITVYWRDRESKRNGRETLSVSLSQQWSELISPRHFQNHRALIHFRPESPDHLERRDLVQSQSQARRAACATARTLQFIDATKLRPSKSHSKAYPGGRSINAIPGRDHYSIWYDANTKRYLFADEPYEAAAVSKEAERTAWAQRHGYVTAKPAWPGMYNPDGGSRLYLVTDAEKGIPLEPIIAALERLPPPIVEEAWNGESAPSIPIFVSPGTIAKTEAAKPKQIQPRKKNGALNSVGYIQTLVGPQRRPKGRMPIEVHAEVGSLLKSVLAVSYNRKGVYNRINSVRSELDEWTQREYNHDELPNELFFDLYYHESSVTVPRTLPNVEREHHIGNMERVKKILRGQYPDCPPLRALVKKVDSAIKSMQTWGS